CDSKALQFADDPLIAPPRVLTRETENECSNLTTHGRATSRARIRPALRYQVPMPSQQCRRCDNEGLPACTWQKSAGRGEENPINGSYRRPAGSAPEDRQFVPQHDDFQVLKLVRPSAQHE